MSEKLISSDQLDSYRVAFTISVWTHSVLKPYLKTIRHDDIKYDGMHVEYINDAFDDVIVTINDLNIKAICDRHGTLPDAIIEGHMNSAALDACLNIIRLCEQTKRLGSLNRI